MRFLLNRFILNRPRLRKALTTLMWGDRCASIQLLGAEIFANTVRENGYFRARRLARYSSLWRDEAPVLVSLALMLEEGDTFVDIGANVGIYTAVFARAARVGKGLRFYAFEANPDTFKRLQRSIAGLEVQAFNVALSDTAGTRGFVEGAVSHVFTSEDQASACHFPDAVKEIPCARLDEFDLAGDSIVLKIDVEGQEMRVLEGARGLFASARVKAVYLDGFKDPAIVPFLRQHGFDLFDGRTLAPSDGETYGLLACRRWPEERPSSSPAAPANLSATTGGRRSTGSSS